MAADVAGFIDEHDLTQPTIIGHSMGAKTAMTLALQSPSLVRDIISVDNAPVDAVMESSFGKYVQAMKKIDSAGITRQSEADNILKDYEPVTRHELALPVNATLTRLSPSQSASSSWGICIGPSLQRQARSSGFLWTFWGVTSTISAISPSKIPHRSGSRSPRCSSEAPKANTFLTTSCL